MMKLGYIQRINLELNPGITEPFRFKECSYTVRMSSRSKRVYSKLFYALDYDDIASTTRILKGNPSMMIVTEPVFLDDDLRERMIRWVEWANKADPKEYDLWAKASEQEGENHE